MNVSLRWVASGNTQEIAREGLGVCRPCAQRDSKTHAHRLKQNNRNIIMAEVATRLGFSIEVGVSFQG